MVFERLNAQRRARWKARQDPKRRRPIATSNGRPAYLKRQPQSEETIDA